MAEDPTPTPPITVHKDPTILLLLVDFVVLILPDLDRQIQSGVVNWTTISHVLIQGIIAFLRLRASDLITGIKFFDKD